MTKRQSSFAGLGCSRTRLPARLCDRLQQLLDCRVSLWAVYCRCIWVEASVQFVTDVVLALLFKEIGLPAVSQHSCLICLKRIALSFGLWVQQDDLQLLLSQWLTIGLDAQLLIHLKVDAV